MFERVIGKLIRQQVEINKVRLGFMPGRRTRDTSFILDERICTLKLLTEFLEMLVGRRQGK